MSNPESFNSVYDVASLGDIKRVCFHFSDGVRGTEESRGLVSGCGGHTFLGHDGPEVHVVLVLSGNESGERNGLIVVVLVIGP